MIKGIFLQNFNREVVSEFKNAGLAHIFLNFEDASGENFSFLKQTLGSDIKINLVFKCFEDKELFEKFSQARALDANGKIAGNENYFPVSPINEETRNFQLQKLKDALSSDWISEVSEIWLNQLQFPTKWNVNEPEILDTDYSDPALKAFSDYIGAEVEGANLEEKVLQIDGCYYHEWLEFKSGFLKNFAEQAKQIFATKSIKTGILFVPWEDKDYGAGIKRIIAQDFNALGDIADEIAPMFYYKDLNADAEWLKSKMEYFWHLGKNFYSFTQIGNNFEEALKIVSGKPSVGIVLNLEDEPKEKLAEAASILQKL